MPGSGLALGPLVELLLARTTILEMLSARVGTTVTSSCHLQAGKPSRSSKVSLKMG